MTRERVPLEKRNVSKARREKIIAAQDGVCKRACCGAPAVDVDHIIPLWAGGSNRDDNLEGLCLPHHQQKTRAEAKARAKAKRIEARITGTRRARKPIPRPPGGGWPPKGTRKLAGGGWPKKVKTGSMGTQAREAGRSEPSNDDAPKGEGRAA